MVFVCKLSCYSLYMFYMKVILWSFTGQPTCETNPNDNACYCVLDSAKDTDNWFLARSYCEDVNGTLVDIRAANDNTFVQNLLGNARYIRYLKFRYFVTRITVFKSIFRNMGLWIFSNVKATFVMIPLFMLLDNKDIFVSPVKKHIILMTLFEIDIIVQVSVKVVFCHVDFKTFSRKLTCNSERDFIWYES